MTKDNNNNNNNNNNLAHLLANPARPVFLLGDVPPGRGTPPGTCQTICDKFQARSRALACDGYIVYDIQDEPSRDGSERPFPFRPVMDSSPYAALLARSSGRPCLVYKCVTVANFEPWLDTARHEHGHNAINLVGRPSSTQNYEGPTMAQAMEICGPQRKNIPFGCVCIAERHTLEAAQARQRDYPTEHQNMWRKQQAGAQWFVSQAVYDAEPTIRLLKDYAALCREKGVPPQKVVLTFCPVSRPKTMQFIKWLGVRVPSQAEAQILAAEKPVDASVEFLCDLLKTILRETAGVDVPLGISCESVSIYKAEIDGVHDLFRRLQGILLDSRGTPWKVQWVEVVTIMPRARDNDDNDDYHKNNDLVPYTNMRRLKESYDNPLIPGLMGVALGGALVAMGVALGGKRN
uniref:Methylenetetrahydrofolate reductase (NAD(P)H) n=1 Tax=Amphora coffeiformis TaxID=265554 RepID=A0A7S3L3E0_9STRA